MRIAFFTVCVGRLGQLRSQARILAAWENQTSIEFKQFIALSPKEYDLVLPELKEFQSARSCRVKKPINKSQIQNQLVAEIDADFVVPLDVDLLPSFKPSLFEALSVSAQSNLFTGYRINSNLEYTKNFAAVYESSLSMSSEDSADCLQKQLLTDEFFGTTPLIPRSDFETVGGYDERFIGWGCEDQDLIDKLLLLDKIFARVPSYLWFHLKHDRENESWYDEKKIRANRELYYRLKNNRKGCYGAQ